MLRNRSRAVTSKQARMADHSSITSSNQDHTRPTSSFFGSPRLFRGFITKGETETVMSPNSMLDTTPFFALENPYFSDKNMPKSPKTSSENKHSWEKSESRGIGLALIGSPNDENPKNNLSKSSSRMVMFGSQLKVQIPPLPPSALSPIGSPKSPADFGIKTRNSQLGNSLSAYGSPHFSIQTKDSPKVFTKCVPVSEMELSEDYTCVISHGPNPRTTHIFDNCIVESCCGVVGSPALRKEENCSLSPASESFLSFCYTCKKDLGQKKDIYIYRGDKAFCSRQCRSQEMLLDGVENSAMDDAFKTCY